MSNVKEQIHRLVGHAQASDASELHLLAELSQEFAQSLDITETLRNAAQTITRFLDAEAASVFLLEEPAHELVCRASAGPVRIDGVRLPVDRGIIGRTLASGTCQMVRDARADPDFNRTVDHDTGFATRSIMCTPLQVRDRTLGVLQVLNKQGEPGLFSEQDLHVLRVLGVSVSLAIHNAHMAQDLITQRRLQQELEMARELQQQLLPLSLQAPFPLNGVNISAHEVSGDFYDYFPLDNGRIGFTIGDVSGKGLNAALLMVRTTSLLRGLGRAEPSLSALLQRVNTELCETSSQGMFVCVVAGVYDPRTREVSWCNAGFPAVLRHHADGHFESLPALAPPLGIDPILDVPQEQLTLADDTLYFYTDGAIEIHGDDGLSLDVDGLQVIIRRHAALAPKQRLEALVENLCALHLRDDTTLLVLEDRRTGKAAERLAEIVVPAQAESLRTLRGVVADATRAAGCRGELVEQLVLALDEACANVIRHAYGDTPGGEIVLSIDREDGQLVFHLRDFAECVDPGQLKPKPRRASRPGGLGLHLIDSIMDSWELRTPDDGHGNLLVMTRTIA